MSPNTFASRGSTTLAALLVLAGCGTTSTSSGGGGAGTTTATGTSATNGTGTTGTATGPTGTGATSTGVTGTGTTTGSGMGAGCKVTMSGVMTGTFSCQIAAAYNTSQNKSAIAFSLAPGAMYPAGVFTSAGGGAVMGEFMTKTYAWTDFLPMEGSYLSVTSPGYSVLGSDNKKPAGTQSLTLTGVTVGVQDANGKTYTVHGTFDSTGPWINGPQIAGTETIHIDF